MAWYDKYLSIYEKPFSVVPESVISSTRQRLAALQSDKPLVTVSVIGYNEEKHLMACLWSLSEMQCKYPLFHRDQAQLRLCPTVRTESRKRKIPHQHRLRHNVSAKICGNNGG